MTASNGGFFIPAIQEESCRTTARQGGLVLHFFHENRMAIQGALTAFFIALLFSLWDGVAWRRLFVAGFICGFVALAVVSFLEQLGVTDMDWSFVTGAAVGGVSAPVLHTLIKMTGGKIAFSA
ncbi:TPA: phage holin family protein [Kluyvera cryocrescens]